MKEKIEDKAQNSILSFLSRGFKWLRKWWNQDTIDYMMEYNKRQDENIFELSKMVEKIIEDNKEIHTELKQLKISQLKSNIFNKSMPLKERVMAGQIYVEELGQNGETKAQYYMLAEKLKDKLKKEEDSTNL
jgi:hypothetical protein